MGTVNNKMTYQNYKHYKLPISMNPIDYGKIIHNNENLFIIQTNTSNVFKINQDKLINTTTLFKYGLMQFEFIDRKLSTDSFIRTINDNKFTFTKGILTRTEITNKFEIRPS